MKAKLMALLVMAAALLGILLTFAPLVFKSPAYDWGISESIPRPAVPADNPMNDTKVALGRWLFYDQRLSANNGVSCASCHVQSQGFSDARQRSPGATGELHPRNSMSLVNSAYASRLTWNNHLLDKLEDQALVPLLGTEPIEMGGNITEIEALLRSDSRYSELFPMAFPADENPYSVLNVVRATSAFVRSIVSFNSPYDRFLQGDTAAISPAAARGMDLFFSERLECFHCHGGFNFTDSTTHASANVERVGYHNTGLYNVNGEGAYPQDNQGLIEMTGNRRDMGRFKAPTLRNIELTAPYMHDGSMATLNEVLDHYARGGREVREGPFAGDGRLNPYKSEFIRGFDLSAGEREDLLAFLKSLSDENVTTAARWSDPWLTE